MPTTKEPAQRRSAFQRLLEWLTWPLAWPDERREWFREQWMRRWARLRQRLLEEGAKLTTTGQLDSPEDVFWLHGDDVRSGRVRREAVTERRQRHEALRQVRLPLTATADEIRALLAGDGSVSAEAGSGRLFPGIALSSSVIDGVAVKADDLLGLLMLTAEQPDLLNAQAILVVPSLEPCWAVVFPRVAGVVADLGGEMSHASILLREARKPAVVNCVGIFTAVRSGDRLRLDGTRGLVEIISDRR
jgi:pyruvate,water dikinase